MPVHKIFSWLIKKRIHQIDLFKQYPIEVQNELLTNLISRAKDTEWGLKFGFDEIASYKDFKENVPLQDYDDVKPWVERLLTNEQNLLWPTDTKWFAKSSGTTSEKSKFIPVTRDSLEDCHYKAGKDLLCLYYHNHPDAKLYKGKHLVVGGSAETNSLSSDSYFGDLSAILTKNLPWWAEIRRTPSKKIALMKEWEEKLDKMAKATMNEDVAIIVGVPSWTLVLLKRILEITGKSDIKEVWPNLELFMHGGVSFSPYEEQFNKIISGKMNYVETYNASEGFFGIQDTKDKKELLLMLDYGIFFEFIPMSDYKGVNSKTIYSLEDVETGIDYALVISTNGGLWRYLIGDTVRFTSTDPYRIVVTGRTKHFINAFGEELVVDNAEKAIQFASEKCGVSVVDYTAAPVYMGEEARGSHEWLIEFDEEPDDLDCFRDALDQHLKDLNSDYEAKRKGDLSLMAPHIISAPRDTFNSWLKSKGKLGGQHKVPRLSNNRKILEDIKSFIH
ncbi:MAG: GH3 auxin-responsive promoter family protein [Crocinitomicaceae bacterium]|nr:GH3 auxin-responsive promoter family protein [Crocinitomicaceae bacterium]